MKANKILVSILVLVCFSAVVLMGCSTEKKYVTYENKNLQFKASVPEDWKKEENKADGVGGVAFGDPSAFSLAITSVEAPDTTDLDESTKGIVQGYKSMPGFKQVSLDKTELGKVPANRFVFTQKEQEHDLKGMIINVIKDKRVYIVMYLASQDEYDKHLKDVEEVLKSFEFIK